MIKKYISAFHEKRCLEKIAEYMESKYHWSQHEYFVKFKLCFYGEFQNQEGKKFVTQQNMAVFSLRKIPFPQNNRQGIQEITLSIGTTNLDINEVEKN